jgi:hypothetical protein
MISNWAYYSDQESIQLNLREKHITIQIVN